MIIDEENNSYDPAGKLKKGIIPPATEDEVAKLLDGIMYQEKKELFAYWESYLRILLQKDGLTNAFQLDCLKSCVVNGAVLKLYDKCIE